MEQLDRWLPIIIISIVFSAFGIVFMIAHNDNYNRFVHKCIEAEGVPVSMMTYTKGYGDSWACVKIDRKVEVK